MIAALASVGERLSSFAAPAGGGAALGAALGYTAAAIARDLGHDASISDYVGRGTGLGAIFGLTISILQNAGVH